MIILKHVEYKIKNSSELKKLLSHIEDTSSKIDGVEFKDIYFQKEKDEFVLVMECITEKSYLAWRDICSPPPGANDWYEVFLTKEEIFSNS